jgi:acyl dehydratase
MALEEYRIETLGQFVGKELGVSDWQTVDQDRINRFADCSGDYQWIHVDEQRAKQESPFGTTIAHGLLCLSLIIPTQYDIGVYPTDAKQLVNYGLDKVRFVAPVKAGARVRNRVELVSAELKANGNVVVKTKNSLEIEGEDKPALIAEHLVMLMA